MFSVQKGTLNIRLEKPELDHFIDAAFLFLLFMLFTFDHAEVGLSLIYYVAYFLFVGLSAIKVIMRMRFDGKVMVSGVTVWYLLFSLFSFATTLWSDYPESMLESVIRMLQIILLLFCLSQTYATQAGITRCLKIISWAATLSAGYIFINTPFDDWFSGRLGIDITGQNANTIGMILTVSTLITMYFAYYKKHRVYYAFLVVQLAAAVLTSSRKTVLAVCLGFMMLIFLKDKSIRLLFRMLFAAAAIAAVFYAIMNTPQLYLAIGRRFESMFDYLNESDVDNSMYMRELFIDYAKRFFVEHPIFGSGPDSFSKKMGEIIGKNVYAHNNFYEVLVSCGLVGFTLYYSMYVYIIVKLLKPALVAGHDTAKMMLTVMAVILVCEYGVVLYYSVYAMVFICTAFLFVCAYDNSIKQQPPPGKLIGEYTVREEDIKWI